MEFEESTILKNTISLRLPLIDEVCNEVIIVKYTKFIYINTVVLINSGIKLPIKVNVK